MTVPTYDTHGAILLESLNALSYDEIRHWVRMMLTGHDIGRGGEAAHDPLAILYPRLSAYRLVREEIQNIISEFVNEFASDSNCIWRAEAGEGLFLLFDPILLNAPIAENVIACLEILLNDEERVPALVFTPNHRRALQGLVTLSYKGSRPFWQWQASIGGEDVLPTIFEGLCELDLPTGFEWLTDQIRPDIAAKIVCALLPYLIDRFGFSDLRPLLPALIAKVSSSHSTLIRDYLTREGFWVDMLVAPPRATVEAAGVATTAALDSPQVVMGFSPPAALAPLEHLYTEFYRGADWRTVLRRFGDVLPLTIEQVAQDSSRTVADLVHDVFRSIREALVSDILGPAELGQEQTNVSEVWVAAHPFLDLVDDVLGGLYEKTLDKLNRGCVFVFFQFDPTYYDAFINKLKNDSRLRSEIVLEGANGQARYVPVRHNYTIMANYSIWDPGKDTMRVLINTGQPIIITNANDMWVLKSPAPLMSQVPLDRGRHLYEDLRKALDSQEERILKKRQQITRIA